MVVAQRQSDREFKEIPRREFASCSATTGFGKVGFDDPFFAQVDKDMLGNPQPDLNLLQEYRMRAAHANRLYHVALADERGSVAYLPSRDVARERPTMPFSVLA